MIWNEAGGFAGNAVPPGQGAFQVNTKDFIIKNMPIDQVSALYIVPGSARSNFSISVAKQTTPKDGTIQN